MSTNLLRYRRIRNSKNRRKACRKRDHPKGRSPNSSGTSWPVFLSHQSVHTLRWQNSLELHQQSST